MRIVGITAIGLVLMLAASCIKLSGLTSGYGNLTQEQKGYVRYLGAQDIDIDVAKDTLATGIIMAISGVQLQQALRQHEWNIVYINSGTSSCQGLKRSPRVLLGGMPDSVTVWPILAALDFMDCDIFARRYYAFDTHYYKTNLVDSYIKKFRQELKIPDSASYLYFFHRDTYVGYSNGETPSDILHDLMMVKGVNPPATARELNSSGNGKQ